MNLSSKQHAALSQAMNGELPRLTLLDGSVRSGKTWISLPMWAAHVASLPKDAPVLMTARTLTSLKRNILALMDEMFPRSSQWDYSLSQKEGRLLGHPVHLEGANDARAETKIRGMTLGGAYCDEVTLLPEDFFSMILSRLSITGARLIGTTNPDTPNHWLMRNYINRADDINMQVSKFLIDDNPFLDPEYVAALKREYVGVFHQRFILGNWCVAEGAIYRLFIDNKSEFMCAHDDVPGLREVLIGVDFGGNQSQHAFCATGFDHNWNVWVLRSESISAKDMDVDTLTRHFVRFCEGIERDFGRVDGCYCDSAEQAIINQFRSRTKYRIYNSEKGHIIDRIRCASMMMGRRGIKFVDGYNKELVKALEEAVWDERYNDDVRLDDGSYNCDALDSWEYSWSYHIARLAR